MIRARAPARRASMRRCSLRCSGRLSAFSFLHIELYNDSAQYLINFFSLYLGWFRETGAIRIWRKDHKGPLWAAVCNFWSVVASG